MSNTDTAQSQINVLLRQAEALLDQAARVADSAQIEFYWDHLGYGWGGTYRPKKMTYEEALTFIAKGHEMDDEMREKIVRILRAGPDDDWQSSDETGWVSSSASC